MRGRIEPPGARLGRQRWSKEGDAEPADHTLDRSRDNWGTNIHVVTDGAGTPLTVHVTPGQTHETKAFEPVENAVRIPQPTGRPRTRPWHLAGDKGYDIPRVRHWLWRYGIKAVIPEKFRPPLFDRASYWRRNVIERCIVWLNHAWRIATHYEKMAVNYLAMLKLAMIQRYF